MNGETLFVSRAGPDSDISERVAGVLERAGYDVILQQRSFVNKSFMGQMQAALESGARTIALLSPNYLASDYCAAEWQSVLAGDPLNKQSRLIVLRIVECEPTGLLKALAYWDLVPARDPKRFESIVLEAVNPVHLRPAHRPIVAARVASVFPGGEAREPLGNLPSQLTAFVGRARVVAEIKVIVENARLVTLLGPGGLGKTRTALQVAAELNDGTGDGVWFVDLAPLASDAYVVPEIAAVLGVREVGGTPLRESVLAFLISKRLLLVLDNCEHVIAEARSVADAILRRAPEVRIIATTREALGVAGEAVYRLATLSVPIGGALGAEEALRYEAVALFVERARTADTRFALTDANAATVADICRRLDGIALAIELAAARIRMLSVTQLAEKLGERFRVLTGGSKTLLPRHQTMRALIDWSYDLLDADERRLFRRLAIFAGGWTLEAATAVCGGDGTDEFTVLDSLTSLADKSLVVVDFEQEAQRFRFLESMRAYALERSIAHGELEPLERARADYFATFAGDGSALGAAMAAKLARIRSELDNVREVLTWALSERHDVELGACLAVALGRFWSTQLPLEGQRWLERARAEIGEDAAVGLRARIASTLAMMLPHGSSERFLATERALELCRAAADPLVLSKALAAYGEQLAAVVRLDEANAVLEEALALARSVGSEWDTARSLACLGMVAADQQDYVTSRATYERALTIFEALEALDGVAYVSSLLGQTEYEAGDVRRGIELLERSRVAYGELQNSRSSASAAVAIAKFALQAGDLERARFYARDTLTLLRYDRHPLYIITAIGILAHVATLDGDGRRGSLLHGYIAFALGMISAEEGNMFNDYHVALERLLEEKFGATELRRLESEGAALSDDRAFEEALAV